jgi:DNA polymerase (family 10)
MVGRAVEKGYDYYAICDHSHRLRDGRLQQQAEQIDALNELVPIQLLKGIEVNIRVTGELDVSDEELASLDWVVASVHASFDSSPTERVLAAMENPYVDCIGHPTARRIGTRAPAGIDLERVIEKALETGTFLELNGQPDRLDLSDVNARAAREAGLKLVIDSDGHRLAALDYVELGVGQARRAGLTKADVVNTRTWSQVERLRKPRRT